MIGKTHFRLRGGRFAAANPEYLFSPSLSSLMEGKQNHTAEGETSFDTDAESISCPGFFSEIDLTE